MTEIEPLAQARCTRCWTGFERVSWIDRVCPFCMLDERRLRSVMLGALAGAAVAFLPLCLGVQALLPEQPLAGGARIAFYLLCVPVGGLLAWGYSRNRRARAGRRAAAAAAGFRPDPRPLTALDRTLLWWAICGVSLVAFPLGAEFAQHWSEGARDPLALAWLTVTEDWEFAGTGLWRWTFGIYWGLTFSAAALWFLVVERLGLHERLPGWLRGVRPGGQSTGSL